VRAGPPRTLSQRALAELAGTSLLVFVGPGAIMFAEQSAAFGHAGVSIAFGVAVALAVAMFGSVSGAHINPAVSVGLALREQLSARELAAYVGAQLLGAVAAVAMLGALLGTVADFGVTRPSVSLPAAFAVEFAYTGVIGIAVAALHAGQVKAHWAPLLLGVVVAIGAYLTGPLTGGSFNPARSIGPALASGVWTAHWIYWLAPITGFSTGYSLWMSRRWHQPSE
jgi:MIP family channel proteins